MKKCLADVFINKVEERKSELLKAKKKLNVLLKGVEKNNPKKIDGILLDYFVSVFPLITRIHGKEIDRRYYRAIKQIQPDELSFVLRDVRNVLIKTRLQEVNLIKKILKNI
ncbi:hypothetical protein KKB71_03650 [Patescibacteria group bacterium]|nr:hypothetical protein [Patescibacteria group bacterium]